MPQNLDLVRKMGGVTAFLVSTLAISNPASALNATIGSTFSSSTASGLNIGQSFINDPAPLAGTGTGATINLNTFSFSFAGTASQTTAAGSILTIYNGIGNGGIIVGTSLPANASTAAVAGFQNPVTWTFTGGLQIIDTSIYSAVLAPSLSFFAGGNLYPNGDLTAGANIPFSQSDTVFQGTFSAVTPVPFEFSPALGLVGLGALWLIKKKFVKKTK